MQASAAPFSRLLDHPKKILYHLPFGESQGRNPNQRVCRPVPASGNCLYDAASRLRSRGLVVANARVDQLYRHMHTQIDQLERSIPVSALVVLRDFEHNPHDRRAPMTREEAQGQVDLARRALQGPALFESMRHYQQAQKGLPVTPENFRQLMQSTLTTYQPFIEQGAFATFAEYLIHLKFGRRFEIHRKLLQNLHGDDAVVEAIAGQHNEPVASIEDFYQRKPLLCVAQLQERIQSLYLQTFGIAPSNWQTHQGVGSLVELLKQKGCALVSGDIGRHIFQTPPVQVAGGLLGGRKVLAWPPGTLKVSHLISRHFILVIGAEQHPIQPELGMVYFLDPTDPSDPKHPQLECIYKISFKTFSERVMKVYQAQDKDPSSSRC